MSDPYRDPPSRPVEVGGDATPWQLRTWQSDRMCPVCAIPLFAASKDAYRIDACGKCGGSWMALADIKRMIDTSEKTPIDLAKMADAVTPSARPAGERACPECKRTLVAEPLGGVQIDVCDEHGTWFDQHELEAVARVLLKEYGLSRRVTDAYDAALKRQEEDWSSVSVQNVALGVATVGLALVGAAVHVPAQFDAFGHPVRIDVLGRQVRLPEK